MEDFYVHFDLEWNRHDIPVTQSIVTEQSVLVILQEINKQLFNDQLKIEVYMYPSEEGSHLKKFWFKAVFLAWTAIGMIMPNVLDGVVMGIWDGRNISEYVRDGVIDIKVLVKWFLEKDNLDLIDSGVQPEKFYKAYKAKNQFYQSALNNVVTKWIGFDSTEDFPIQRNQFVRKISDLPDDLSDVAPVDKYHKLIVVSSINTEEEKDLAWQFKDEKLKRRFQAYMKDEAFYEFFLWESIYLKTLLVKVRYFFKKDENGVVCMGKKEVLNVYSYNDTEFTKFPDDAKIETAPLGIEIIDDNKDKIENENIMKLF